MPSSRSTRALARRVTREATDPSRANAISLLRSSSLRKWARIMPPSESAKPENSRLFYRDFNESGYTVKTGRVAGNRAAQVTLARTLLVDYFQAGPEGSGSD